MAYVPKTSFHKDWAARDREDMTLPFILGTQAILMQIIQNRTLWVKVCFAYIFFCKFSTTKTGLYNSEGSCFLSHLPCYGFCLCPVTETISHLSLLNLAAATTLPGPSSSYAKQSDLWPLFCFLDFAGH